MLRTTMGLAITFLVIALIAGLFGFIGVGSLAWGGGEDPLLHLPRPRGAGLPGRLLFLEQGQCVACLTGKGLTAEVLRADPTTPREHPWPLAPGTTRSRRPPRRRLGSGLAGNGRTRSSHPGTGSRFRLEEEPEVPHGKQTPRHFGQSLNGGDTGIPGAR